MRIDVLTIFPQFFQVLDLSLMGKAQAKDHSHGGVSFGIHDLREWATDRHRTVDDAPYGGGAGMVMRPDVWGKAIDTVIDASPAAGRRVLAIPTPAGEPLQQARVEDLAHADQIIIACGRYEGIDYRVVEEYSAQETVEVLEYSIGDYVLNGGEVAALALIEAVARLREGFMSNPLSLSEESFSDHLLEYPAYTRPANWRGHEVPKELLGGNHALISQWRRRQSLRRTANRRPDLVKQLPVHELSVQDREDLVRLGWVNVTKQWKPIQIRPAQIADLEPLLALVQRTFPHACPTYLDAETVANHIEKHLDRDTIADWLTCPDKQVLVAQVGADLVGYTMVENYPAGDYPADVPAHYLQPAPTYLSKCYVDADYRGTGTAGALLETTVAKASSRSESQQIVLGTNRTNERAIKFYRRHGFKRRGRRIFLVDGVRNEDVVLIRPLPGSPNETGT